MIFVTGEVNLLNYLRKGCLVYNRTITGKIQLKNYIRFL